MDRIELPGIFLSLYLVKLVLESWQLFFSSQIMWQSGIFYHFFIIFISYRSEQNIQSHCIVRCVPESCLPVQWKNKIEGKNKIKVVHYNLLNNFCEKISIQRPLWRSKIHKCFKKSTDGATYDMLWRPPKIQWPF